MEQRFIALLIIGIGYLFGLGSGILTTNRSWNDKLAYEIDQGKKEFCVQATHLAREGETKFMNLYYDERDEKFRILTRLETAIRERDNHYSEELVCKEQIYGYTVRIAAAAETEKELMRCWSDRDNWQSNALMCLSNTGEETCYQD